MWEGVFGDLCGRFVGECPRWSVTSIKLHGCFVGVAFQCGCSPVNILHFFSGGGGRGGGGVGAFMTAPLEGCFCVPNIYIYIYINIPSTHLTHFMCILKHKHFIYFSIFSGLDDKT